MIPGWTSHEEFWVTSHSPSSGWIATQRSKTSTQRLRPCQRKLQALYLKWHWSSKITDGSGTMCPGKKTKDMYSSAPSGSVVGSKYLFAWCRLTETNITGRQGRPISFPYHSHTSRDPYGSNMGMGVPLLGLPQVSLEFVKSTTQFFV